MAIKLSNAREKTPFKFSHIAIHYNKGFMQNSINLIIILILRYIVLIIQYL